MNTKSAVLTIQGMNTKSAVLTIQGTNTKSAVLIIQGIDTTSTVLTIQGMNTKSAVLTVEMGHSTDPQGKDDGKNSKPARWGKQTTSGNKGREGESHDH